MLTPTPLRPTLRPMNTVNKILGTNPITAYLRQCQVRNTLVEGGGESHVPPSPDEVKTLLDYLEKKGVEAAIVGSVGVLHYVKDTEKFRPTYDLDLFVKITEENFRKIKPPVGWTTDRTAVGVASWISPSGGYVDFMTTGHTFPDGHRTPASVAVDPSSKEYPVATATDLFRLKLGSMRDKDLYDMVSLARALGSVPSEKVLGKLNSTQKENLGMVQQWFKLRPAGGYGE